jgi:hypothetical protein
MVALKRTRRLISANVSPDFRVRDSFRLISHSHSLTRLKINALFEFRSSRFLSNCAIAYELLSLTGAPMLRMVTRVLGIATDKGICLDKEYTRFGCSLILRNAYANPSFFN